MANHKSGPSEQKHLTDGIASSPEAAKPTSRKQSFIAEFNASYAHLHLSKSAIGSLAIFAVNSDDETVAALRELMAQPDPHGSLAAALTSKARDVRTGIADLFEPFKEDDDFTHWVKSANFCFHAVDEIIISNWAGTKPRRDDHLASCFALGVWHYRRFGQDYSDEQVKGFALIAAAAHCAERKAYIERENDAPAQTINVLECSEYFAHEHFRCKRLGNKMIMELAAASSDAADEILRIILDRNVYSEAGILYYLNGGHSALVDGLI